MHILFWIPAGSAGIHSYYCFGVQEAKMMNIYLDIMHRIIQQNELLPIFTILDCQLVRIW